MKYQSQKTKIVYQQVNKQDPYDKLFHQKFYLIFYCIFTFYALFGDDLRQLISVVKTDNLFYAFMTITFFFFIFDMSLLLFLKKDYYKSSFFVIDFIGTFSLLLDIKQINTLFFETPNRNEYAILARAARISFLVNFFVKYMVFFKALTKQRGNMKLSMKDQLRDQQFLKKEIKTNYFLEKNLYEDRLFTQHKKIHRDVYQSSKQFFQKERKKENFFHYHQAMTVKHKLQNSGKTLQQSYSQLITILVLLLIFVIPIFNVQSYYTKSITQRESLKYMSIWANSKGIDSTFQSLWNQYLQIQKDDRETFVSVRLYQLVDSQETFDLIQSTGESTSINQLEKKYRYYELLIYEYPQNQQEYKVQAIWQCRELQDFNSWLNILRTLFMILILFIFGIQMKLDIQSLFIEPFNQLMKKIQMINKDPIDTSNDQKKFKKIKYQNELDDLYVSLQNSSKLLGIGFGQAAKDIIQRQLRNDGIDNLISGNKIMAIFGFAVLKDFQEYTNVFKEQVLVFINSIAETLHGTVGKYDGKINKNIGEAFLIVWKFPEELYEKKLVDNQMTIQLIKDNRPNNRVQKICETAIFSFIELQIRINQNKIIQGFLDQEKIREEIKDHNKILNLGLHMGWGIEGAIGSQHKIDVSYLSPNVNLASRVAVASIQYGKSFLVSHVLLEKCGPLFRDKFRIVDRVYLKGSKKPMSLYTFDMVFDNDMNLEYMQFMEKVRHNKEQRLKSIFKKQQKKILKKIQIEKILPIELFEDEDVQRANQYYQKNRKFFKFWKNGFQNYQNGDWENAYDNFLEVKEILQKHKDGPTLNLLQFLEENNLTPPENWNGVRKLTSKQFNSIISFLHFIFYYHISTVSISYKQILSLLFVHVQNLLNSLQIFFLSFHSHFYHLIFIEKIRVNSLTSKDYHVFRQIQNTMMSFHHVQTQQHVVGKILQHCRTQYKKSILNLQLKLPYSPNRFLSPYSHNSSRVSSVHQRHQIGFLCKVL